MSIIHVSGTTSLSAAILAKAVNTTVSTKTLKKIEEVAARLYGVNNSGNLRLIDSPLGKAAFKNDVNDCMKAIETMPDTRARRDLGTLLQRIETRTAKAYERLDKSFSRGDIQDMKKGVTNLENNFRLAYLLGSQGGTNPK
ncbi:hypothetical protein [Pinirhizobacter soli]|uniref:hypothetical protein n=1 Tax=Pinirhizobacter soli TaxID=2786953 RepID=UPI00202A41B9|nr:hypothetical protein [Pinirhizobacter soli]